MTTRKAETEVAVPTRFLVTDGTVEGSQVGSATAAQMRTALNVEDGANNYAHPNHTGDVTSTGDGATAITAGVIVDADVNAAAAIASSKLAFLQAGIGAVAQSAESKMRETVSVDDFGATGDGTTEDTTAINAALAAHDVVHFTAGKTYITDRIAVPAGKTLIGYGATLKLKAFDGAAANYKSVIDLVHVTNVSIYGLTIDGNRAAHTTTGSITGDEDSGMHGIDIMGGSGHVFVDVTAQNCYGDGIIFVDGNYQFGDNSDTPATHITVTRCLFDNNRRQGCTIVHVTDLTFNQCGFTNTAGTLPEYGVDIEPDPLQTHQFNRRIYFSECWFTGNTGKGFGMLIPGQTVEDVVLLNCNVTGNTEAYSIWPNVNNSGTLRRFAIIGGKFDKICRIGQSIGVPGDRTAIFDDCLIEGVTLTGDAAIQIVNTLGEGWNVKLRNIHANGITSAEFIRVYDAEGVLIEGCSIDAATRIIRAVTTANRLTIRDNHLRGMSNEAIALTGTINDLKVENNRIDKAAVVGSAISWTTGARAIIAGNTITGSAGNWLTTGANTDYLVLGYNEKGGRAETIAGTNTIDLSQSGGTVTSVAVSGSDGIEVDSGSPVTSSGTIALGVHAANMVAHLGAVTTAGDQLVSAQANNDLTTNPKFWRGTQAEYDALTPTAGEIYLILEV